MQSTNLKLENIRNSILTSIKALGNRKKLRVFYLHEPEMDRSTPFEETAEAINILYEEGLL